MAPSKRFLAFDLGAESGRGVLGLLDKGRLTLEEAHRFPNGPVRLLGNMHWDVLRLFEEMKKAMRACRALHGRDLDGIACDSWGVDFALFGRGNVLLGNPYHYRDSRTDGMMEQAFKRVPRQEIYELTGVQFIQLNTLYQLLAMAVARSPLLEAAERLVMMAELFHFLLCGRAVAEFTLATTSQAYNPRENAWARSLLGRLGIPDHIMPEIVPAGTVLGTLLADVADDAGLGRVPVIAAASHDTAAAVAAVPAEGTDWAYISSGTWSLIGAETAQPIISDLSLKYNITNEGGVGGTFRFLNNNMGLWLLQECRRKWQRDGRDIGYAELTRMAEQAPAFAALVEPDHASFLNPPDMPAAIVDFCRKTGQKPPETRPAMVRCILESLALKYRVVLDRIAEAVGRPFQRVHIVGGGSQNTLLSQFTANAAQSPVLAGPVEATAMGNVLMQAVATGVLGSVADARKVVRNSTEVVTYEPRDSDQWAEARERFERVMA